MVSGGQRHVIDRRVPFVRKRRLTALNSHTARVRRGFHPAFRRELLEEGVCFLLTKPAVVIASVC